MEELSAAADSPLTITTPKKQHVVGEKQEGLPVPQCAVGDPRLRTLQHVGRNCTPGGGHKLLHKFSMPPFRDRHSRAASPTCIQQEQGGLQRES